MILQFKTTACLNGRVEQQYEENDDFKGQSNDDSLHNDMSTKCLVAFILYHYYQIESLKCSKFDRKFAWLAALQVGQSSNEF
ncbi:hypothetical protein OIU76_021883, partial [Salix suchowensis]